VLQYVAEQRALFHNVSLVRKRAIVTYVRLFRILCCHVLQCVAVRCSVLQCVAVCCSVLQCVAAQESPSSSASKALSTCVRKALPHPVSQCVAVRCSALQYVAVCCSMFQHNRSLVLVQVKLFHLAYVRLFHIPAGKSPNYESKALQAHSPAK